MPHRQIKMGISLDQTLVIILVTVGCLFFGVLPFLGSRYTSLLNGAHRFRYNMTISIFSCIGAGVLLSTLALHLLPETREQLSVHKSITSVFDPHFAVTEMILLCGFVGTYLIEEIAHFIMTGAAAR